MTSPSLPHVAYFCMEYALHEDLPIYAGGLGVLAGDYVKAAGDLGLPLTAIGLLWRHAYTVQRIGQDGSPYDEYPPTPREDLIPVDVQVSVTLRGKEIALTAYRVTRDGNAPLYLLEPVDGADRWVVARLYGGHADDRVAQEIVLGVGGVRLLRALGIPADVYHFNEGHAVFAGLELVREQMEAGRTFAEAWAETRKTVVFTTHTPVLAGNEAHAIDLLVRQGADLGVFSPEQLEELGGDPFGMTVAGLRLSRIANGVAELHGNTSRKMWADVLGAAPIVSVTNGVHHPTWQDVRMRAAYANGALWDTHEELKRELLAEVRQRTGVELGVDRLLVGFARRAAAYKRADLILRDLEVVGPLLESGRLQLLFAGKAHPQDGEGKRVIASLVATSRRYPRSIVFLENYDMKLGRLLTRGCDVWLNNPRRPMEASGTSGMKAAMNGVLNLSILDGWWAEACEHGVNGWQVGDGCEGPLQDGHDLKALLSVLREHVMPTYYEDRPRWIDMMRASIESSQWPFSSDRMIEDYYSRIYRQ